MKLNRNIIFLAFGFLFIFLGYSSIQQYITTYFAQEKVVKVGFYSLILIYSFFMLTSPLASFFIRKYGAKRCMMLASLLYGFFILSLLVKSSVIVYFSSSMVGIAASLLWNGQNSYLIRASQKEYYGRNAGFFTTIISISTTIGVLAIWLLLQYSTFSEIFLFFSMFPFIGFCLLYIIEDIRVQSTKNHFITMKKALFSLTAWRFSTIWFAFTFITGLVVGFIPLEINRVLGLSYIGPLSSAFFVIPILFSYNFGKISDNIGRKPLVIISFILAIIGLFLLYFSTILTFIIGLFLLAIFYALIRPSNLALVGDVSTNENMDSLNSLFWIMQTLGQVVALFVSLIVQSKMVYLYSIGVMIFLIFCFLPLFKLPISEIKKKLAEEIN